MRAALGVVLERMTPTELMKTVLRAPVDLLWNGGIGTYVKASTETHSRGRRPHQRRGAHRRRRAAVPDGRRGRQPRLHPARPDRVRARRRADLHGRDRQLGRRRLQRPRGQHQDPARRRGGGRRDDAQAAQQPARRDDRRGRRARARQQPGADAGADGRPRPERCRWSTSTPATSTRSRRGLARPRTRVPPVGQADRRAPVDRLRPHHARVRGADRLHEERQRGRDPHQRPARRSGARRGPVRLLPGAAARAVRRTSCATACAARSPPPSSSTRWPTSRGSRSTIA